jgi:hypothetical protein
MSQQLTSSQQKCVEEEIVEDEANKCANIEEVAEWTSEDENDEADQEEQEEEQVNWGMIIQSWECSYAYHQ